MAILSVLHYEAQSRGDCDTGIGFEERIHDLIIYDYDMGKYLCVWKFSYILKV